MKFKSKKKTLRVELNIETIEVMAKETKNNGVEVWSTIVRDFECVRGAEIEGYYWSYRLLLKLCIGV